MLIETLIKTRKNIKALTTFYFADKIFYPLKISRVSSNVTMQIDAEFSNVSQTYVDAGSTLKWKSYKGLHGDLPCQTNPTTDCCCTRHTDVKSVGEFNCVTTVLMNVLFLRHLFLGYYFCELCTSDWICI